MAELNSQNDCVVVPRSAAAAPKALAMFKSHMKSSKAFGLYAKPNSVPMQRGIDAYSPKDIRLAQFGYVVKIVPQTWCYLWFDRWDRKKKRTRSAVLYSYSQWQGKTAMRLYSAHRGLQAHKLTTLVSSLRNCRRYLAISCAIPLGSLMFFWRRS